MSDDARSRWQDAYAAAEESGRLRGGPFTTLDGEPLEPVYAPEDGAVDERIGWPGEFPFTRGRPDGLWGRLWTMRQFAGFGSAAQTNDRYAGSWRPGRVASVASTCRRSWGSTPTTCEPRARSATAESPSTPPPTWMSLTGSRWPRSARR